MITRLDNLSQEVYIAWLETYLVILYIMRRHGVKPLTCRIILKSALVTLVANFRRHRSTRLRCEHCPQSRKLLQAK